LRFERRVMKKGKNLAQVMGRLRLRMKRLGI